MSESVFDNKTFFDGNAFIDLSTIIEAWRAVQGNQP